MWIAIAAIVAVLGVVFAVGYKRAKQTSGNAGFTIVYSNNVNSDLEPCG